MKTLLTSGLRWLGTIAALVVGLVSASAGPVRADGNSSAVPVAATSDHSAHAALNDHFFRGLAEDIRAAMQSYRMLGSAVAVVHGNRIVWSRGFGVRNEQSGAKVTANTLFRVASTTKSMASLMTATYVDDGVLGWNDRVVAIWPAFRAPTPALTRRLRVRDLMGAATGLEEPGTYLLDLADRTPLDTLRSLQYETVAAPPGQQFIYNNTVYAAGGYLPLLASGVVETALGPAFVQAMRERVFRPAGMRTAAITSDPRTISNNFATPYTRSLLGGNAPVPFNSIGGGASAGSATASVLDMAHLLIVHINKGLAADGRRVVSPANLAETHKPHIDMPANALFPPGAVRQQYALGWYVVTFADGRRMIAHNGEIEGSATYMSFFPRERIGFVVVNNLDPGTGSTLFNIVVHDRFVRRLFGCTGSECDSIYDLLRATYKQGEEQRAQLAMQIRPVDPAAVAWFLGYYDHGWRVALADRETLRITHDQRPSRLRALDDGSYVGIDGFLLATRVHFSTDEGGSRLMKIEGFEPGGVPPLQWLTGNPIRHRP